MKIRYDREGDTIEFIVTEKEGKPRQGKSPFVTETIDAEGNTIAVSILKVSTLKEQGQDIELLDIPAPAWTDFKLWYEMKS